MPSLQIYCQYKLLSLPIRVERKIVGTHDEYADELGSMKDFMSK